MSMLLVFVIGLAGVILFDDNVRSRAPIYGRYDWEDRSTWADTLRAELAGEVARLRRGGFTLLDTQFTTPHLESLGARAVPRSYYHDLLARAIEAARTGSLPTHDVTAEMEADAVLEAGIDLSDELFHLVALTVSLSILAHSSTDVLVARQFKGDDIPADAESR